MKLKYTFSLLAALVFFSVLLPITAYAAGLDSHNFDTDGNYTITVDETLSVSKTIPSGRMLTIDSGATLTINENVTLTIAPGGTVNILTGLIDVRYEAKIENSGFFCMGGGTRIFTDNAITIFKNNPGATVTMLSDGNATFDLFVENYGSFTSGDSNRRFAFSRAWRVHNYNTMDYVSVIEGSFFSNYGTVESVIVDDRSKVYNYGVINGGSGPGPIYSDLRTLSLSSGQLLPAFTNQNKNYKATTDAESITVSGAPCTLLTPGKTTMTVNGQPVAYDASFTSQSIPLNKGANTVTVKLFRDGNTHLFTYTIAVTRVEPTPTPTPTYSVPRTGDEQPTGLLLTLMLLSGAVLVCGIVKRKKSA